MKNFALAFSFILFTLFSFADGGCSVAANHTLRQTVDGQIARLTYFVSGNGTADCDKCNQKDFGVWYKYNGSSFVLISRAANGKPDVYEPGTYKVEVCGAYGITIIPEGKVYRNKEITEAVITKFSIFPNPSKNEAVRMLVPTSSISLQSETYKLEVFNTVGTRVLLKDNLQFGNHSITIDLKDTYKGVYFVRIICGEEVRVLKMMRI